jgi:hypothetical protein
MIPAQRRTGIRDGPAVGALSTAETPYLKTTQVPPEAVQRFRTLQRGFPPDASVVRAGGWHNLERLALDPKGEMVDLVVAGLRSTASSKVQPGRPYTMHDDERLEALQLLLYGMGKGFDADLIDGEWDLVFTRQGTKSPAFQKLVGRTETARRSKNVFDIRSMTFGGDVRFWRFGKVSTKVKVGGNGRRAAWNSNLVLVADPMLYPGSVSVFVPHPTIRFFVISLPLFFPFLCRSTSPVRRPTRRLVMGR